LIQSSLQQNELNYSGKKFYNSGPRWLLISIAEPTYSLRTFEEKVAEELEDNPINLFCSNFNKLARFILAHYSLQCSEVVFQSSSRQNLTGNRKNVALFLFRRKSLLFQIHEHLPEDMTDSGCDVTGKLVSMFSTFFVTQAPAKSARMWIQGMLTEEKGSVQLTSSLR
jgi:hypothetical protein